MKTVLSFAILLAVVFVSANALGQKKAKKTPLQTFSSVNSYGLNGPEVFRTGEPVPGAEIYIELEPDDEPIANVTTDANGAFYFETADLPNYPAQGTLVLTILPPKGFAKGRAIPAGRQKVRVPFRTPADGSFRFVLFWEHPLRSAAENKGAFAVSEKNST